MSDIDIAWPGIFLVLTIFAVMALAGLMRRRSTVNTWGRLCAACGTFIPSFARFCSHCGRSVEQDKVSTK